MWLLGRPGGRSTVRISTGGPARPVVAHGVGGDDLVVRLVDVAGVQEGAVGGEGQATRPQPGLGAHVVGDVDHGSGRRCPNELSSLARGHHLAAELGDEVRRRAAARGSGPRGGRSPGGRRAAAPRGEGVDLRAGQHHEVAAGRPCRPGRRRRGRHRTGTADRHQGSAPCVARVGGHRGGSRVDGRGCVHGSAGAGPAAAARQAQQAWRRTGRPGRSVPSPAVPPPVTVSGAVGAEGRWWRWRWRQPVDGGDPWEGRREPLAPHRVAVVRDLPPPGATPSSSPDGTRQGRAPPPPGRPPPAGRRRAGPASSGAGPRTAALSGAGRTWMQ